MRGRPARPAQALSVAELIIREEKYRETFKGLAPLVIRKAPPPPRPPDPPKHLPVHAVRAAEAAPRPAARRPS